MPTPKTPLIRGLASRADELRASIPTARAPSRRTCRDKKYFLLKIKDHMAKIRAETAQIVSQRNSHLVSTQSLAVDRSSAKAGAKVFEESQKELNVLNAVLQMHLAKMTMRDVVDKTEGVKDEIQEKLRGLEKAFRYKRKCKDLKNSIEDVLKAEQDVLDLMKEDDRQTYLMMYDQNKELLKNIVEGESRIKEMKSTINRLQEFIKDNPQKAVKINILKKIQEKNLEIQNLELDTGNNSVHSLKSDKKDIEALGKVKARLEEEIRSKEKELQEITRIINSGSKSKLKKYIVREDEIANYLDKFDQNITDIHDKIKRKNAKITCALDYLLEKTDNNVDEISSSELSTDNYLLLKSKAKKLEDFGRKYENEIGELLTRLNALRKEVARYNDIDLAQEENEIKAEQLEDQKKMLNATLMSTSAASRKAKQQLVELQVMLSEDDHYLVILEMYDEMEKLSDEEKGLREDLEASRGVCGEFIEDLNEIDQLTERINANVKERLAKKYKRLTLL